MPFTSNQAPLPTPRARVPGLARTAPRAGGRRLLGGLRLRRSRPEGAREFELGRDGTLALRPGRGGLVLACESGEFVVTQEGDPDDHVVEQGGRFRTRSRGLVVAWALCPGVLVGPARRCA
jgi:hypothetical protein